MPAQRGGATGGIVFACFVVSSHALVRRTSVPALICRPTRQRRLALSRALQASSAVLPKRVRTKLHDGH